MKKISEYLLVSILILLMVNCSGNSNENKDTSGVESVNKEDNVAPMEQTQASAKVYDIESGYIKIINKASGFDLITERWFDNFGALQYEENYMIISGTKNGSSILIKDGSRYTWNFESKEGQHFKNYHAPKNSYDALSQREIERYGIKKLGEEKILGRMCQKLSTEKPAKTVHH